MLRWLYRGGLVALGAALGGVLRWAIWQAAEAWLGPAAVPWATMLVNVAGCFLMGWLTALAGRLAAPGASWPSGEGFRLFAVVGFAGTFSTFAYFADDAHGFLSKDSGWLATFYLAASLTLGLLAVRLGTALAGRTRKEPLHGAGPEGGDTSP